MEIRCNCELCQKQNERMILRIKAQEAAARAEQMAKTGDLLNQIFAKQAARASRDWPRRAA